MNTLFFFPENLYAQLLEKKWDDNISLSGDIRLRWESVTKNPGSDTTRERFRSRFGIATNLAENVELIFRIETGIDDPVSSNQTFGNGLDIGIGRAYADWKVNNNTRILGGKMKLPWFVAGGNRVLWDSDFNPEGGFASFQSNNNLFDVSCYHPLDFPWSAFLFLNSFKPKIYLTTRHDIWPHHLVIAKSLNIKCYLINANLYDNSKRLYPMLKSFNKFIFNKFDKILTGSIQLKKTLSKIVSNDKVIITGDSRFDQIL